MPAGATRTAHFLLQLFNWKLVTQPGDQAFEVNRKRLDAGLFRLQPLVPALASEAKGPPRMKSSAETANLIRNVLTGKMGGAVGAGVVHRLWALAGHRDQPAEVGQGRIAELPAKGPDTAFPVATTRLADDRQPGVPVVRKVTVEGLRHAHRRLIAIGPKRVQAGVTGSLLFQSVALLQLRPQRSRQIELGDHVLHHFLL